MPSPDDAHAPSIQVIGRMFSLLEALASQPHPMPLKQLSERTGLHPSTAHRILNDLTLGGWVERPSSGHYKLGLKLLAFGNIVRSRLDVKALALAPLRDLHRRVKAAVTLYLREGDNLCALPLQGAGRGMPDGFGQPTTLPGRLHESQLGLAWLAHEPPLSREHYALRHGQTAVATVEAQGAGQPGRSFEVEIAPGRRAAAGFVFDDAGRPAAVVALDLPLPDGRDGEALQEVALTAGQISRALGADAA